MNTPIFDELRKTETKKNAPLLKVLDESRKQQSSLGLWVLNGMNVRMAHIYAGTVPESVVQKRRAKNRVAKKSRKINRAR